MTNSDDKATRDLEKKVKEQDVIHVNNECNQIFFSKLTQLPYIYNWECFDKYILNLDLESIGEDHTIDLQKIPHTSASLFMSLEFTCLTKGK
jgi:hypothetical protein